MRLMMMVRSNKDTEAGVPPNQEEIAAMGALMEDMVKAGVLILADGLKPSSAGKRLKISGGKVTKVIDGPFAETKELIAGFCLAEFKSWDEALEWSDRFAEALGEGESELRPLFEASDFPPEALPPEDAAREQAMRDELQKAAKAR